MSLSRINNLLRNIRNEVEVKEAVKEIFEVLDDLPKDEVSIVANEMDLGIVFDCLNVDDDEQILHVCGILEICLPEIEARALWTEHEVDLARALQHPVIKVKETLMESLIRISAVPFLMNTLQGDNLVDFFVSAIICMCCKEEYIGTKSIELLTNLAQSYIHGFCHPRVVEILQSLTKSDEVLKTRLLNVVVEVGTKSPNKLSHMEVTGILTGIIETLKSHDILAVMANLEVLTPLANTQQGFTFLVANGILDLIAQKLAASDIETSTLDALLYPSIIKFFASIGYHNPVLFRQECSSVLSIMIKNTESEDNNIKVASMGGLAYYSSSRLGKQIIHDAAVDPGKIVYDCFQAANISSEFQTKYLLAFEHFMHVELSPLPSARERPFRNENELYDLTCMKITKAWFDRLGPTALQTLLDMAKLPFVDVKLGSFHIIKEIVSQNWGLQKCYSYPAFMEYILNRSEHSTTLNRNLITEVVSTMATNRYAQNIIDSEEILKKIKDIHLHGHHRSEADCIVSLQH